MKILVTATTSPTIIFYVKKKLLSLFPHLGNNHLQYIPNGTFSDQSLNSIIQKKKNYGKVKKELAQKTRLEESPCQKDRQ